MPLPTSFVVKNGSKIFGCRSSSYPGAVVVDLEDDRLSLDVVPAAYDERATAIRREHRLLRVDDEIQQDLLNLVRIGEDLGQSRRERIDDGDVRDALLVRSQREGLAHDMIQVDHRARRLPLARERQEIADDLRRALGLAEDRLEAALRLLVDFRRRALRQPFGPRQDRGERVVQLVRDAGNRLAERRQLLGLQELVIQIAGLVLEFLALADVADEGIDADRSIL